MCYYVIEHWSENPRPGHGIEITLSIREYAFIDVVEVFHSKLLSSVIALF